MLQLKIDGLWEPQDFINLFHSIESFYYKLAKIRSFHFMPPYWLDERFPFREDERIDGRPFKAVLDQINQRMAEQARYETPSSKRLSVARIQYASPGGIDLLGIGKVFETLASSIGHMKTYFDETGLRSEREKQARLDTELKGVEIEKARENLQSLKIKNAHDALQLVGMYPEMREALVPLLVRDQDAIANLLAERKLISAHVSAGDQKKD